MSLSTYECFEIWNTEITAIVDIGITTTWEAFENLKEILPGSVPKVLPPVVPGAPKPPPPRLQAGEDGWDTELDAPMGAAGYRIQELLNFSLDLKGGLQATGYRSRKGASSY